VGFFSRRPEEEEPSYSRAWLAQNGDLARKVRIAIAVIARLARQPVGDASSWGRSLDDRDLTAAHRTFEEAAWQDRSLARHVARDLTLLFESNGGIARNQAAAFESVDLDPSPSPDTTGSPSAQRVAAQALAVARTIQARSQGGEAAPSDLAVYMALYEDQSNEGQDRAIDIGAWSAVVVARLATADRLPNGALFLEPGSDFIGQMEGVGWYPNPVNHGDTDIGDAAIERWWDGGDWTDRVRYRDGRHWTETEVPLFTTPNN
jgi:hypothetical protein